MFHAVGFSLGAQVTGHLGYKLQGRIQRITGLDPAGMSNLNLYLSIVGSVVECSPATRAARVRFPDDANSFFLTLPIFIPTFCL